MAPLGGGCCQAARRQPASMGLFIRYFTRHLKTPGSKQLRLVSALALYYKKLSWSNRLCRRLLDLYAICDSVTPQIATLWICAFCTCAYELMFQDFGLCFVLARKWFVSLVMFSRIAYEVLLTFLCTSFLCLVYSFMCISVTVASCIVFSFVLVSSSTYSTCICTYIDIVLDHIVNKHHLLNGSVHASYIPAALHITPRVMTVINKFSFIFTNVVF